MDRAISRVAFVQAVLPPGDFGSSEQTNFLRLARSHSEL